MAMRRARGCTVLRRGVLDETRHAALNCAALYCVVEHVVRGIRIAIELTWTLNSS